MKVRRFVLGRDEQDWVKVRNAAFKEFDDDRQIFVEEFRAFEKAPEFDAEGRFIAVLNGQPVGVVHAHVDKLRKEKKGFVRSLGVVPEFRGRGIAEELADIALKELKGRSMEVVQAWAADSRDDRIRLWESLRFKLVRKFSLMKRDLDEIPSGIGEDGEIVLTNVRKDSDDDLKLLNWLDNECFKEHFNYRPGTLERTMFFVREDPFFKVQDWFFAVLDGEHVGYVGLGVDEKYNVERGVQCGWIMDIGVLKPYRRRGVGTRLMLQGMENLKDLGMSSVMLGVDDWNVTKAMRLYEKCGFGVVKKDLTYERNIE